jgi:hypothetical protein
MVELPLAPVFDDDCQMANAGIVQHINIVRHRILFCRCAQDPWKETRIAQHDPIPELFPTGSGRTDDIRQNAEQISRNGEIHPFPENIAPAVGELAVSDPLRVKTGPC